MIGYYYGKHPDKLIEDPNHQVPITHNCVSYKKDEYHSVI